MITKAQLDEVNAAYPNDKAYQMLGALNLTLPQFLSGNRGVMDCQFMEHAVPLINPETPAVPTGFEKAYGKYTDSYLTSDADYRVIAVIPKYTITGRFNYIYILQNVLTKVYTLYEVKHYECLSEEQGYLRPFTHGDEYKPGDVIKKGSLIYKSNNHDEYGNYRYGLNPNVCFISLAANEEDGMVISDEFYERCSFYNFNKTSITLNKNQILLNLYGDANNYKCFPDISEEVKDGMVYAKRTVNYDNAAAELTENALCHITASDEVCRGHGYVADIDVFIHDGEEFEDAGNKSQIFKYYAALVKFYTEIVRVLKPIVEAPASARVQYTHQLSDWYCHACDYIEKKSQFTNNNNNFEFAYIEIVTYEKKNIFNGYKITDRFGGKGVISKIVPKSYMPRDQFGNVADIILSPPGVPARANPGQLYEVEYSFIAGEWLKRIRKMPTMQQKVNAIVEFAMDSNPEEGVALKQFLAGKDEAGLIAFFEDTYQTGLFPIQKPFGGTISPENLEYLYTKYKVKPGKITMKCEFKHNFTALPIENANIPSIEGCVREGKATQYFMPKDGLFDNGVTPFDVDKKKKEEYIFGAPGVLPMVDQKTGEVVYRTISTDAINGGGNTNSGGFKVKAEINDAGFLVRTYESDNNVIIGKKYYMVLKQNPDDKFSARSLGSTNQVGIPNKPGKQGNMMSPYSKSAIRNGEMESDNLFIRIPSEIVHRYISTYSTNPLMIEKLSQMLLTEDPMELHDLDLNDDEFYDDVPALMLHSYLFSIGIEIKPIYRDAATA